jgi:oligoribonuclease NrnB/cAMP/cGMP phosphodiesterase (DHH superfamily)
MLDFICQLNQTPKTTMKTVIHHSADYDGIFCREIARKFLPSDTTFIGWDFKDPRVPWPTDGKIYILDLSPECLDIPDLAVNAFDRIVWIDHHKTSIEKWPITIPGYRIDGVSACRLAWQWFTHEIANDVMSDAAYLPKKEEYLQRSVKEPLAVRLAGEYDIWDHRGDGDLEFQYGLRVEGKDIAWNMLLSENTGYTDHLVNQGKTAMRYSQGVDASVIKANSFILNWEGLKFLALNTARCNSLTFAAKDVPETGHDALLAFYTNGLKWTVSLYHASHRKDIDLSEIAKKYGGGGHRGACGFTADKLPWLSC